MGKMVFDFVLCVPKDWYLDVTLEDGCYISWSKD